MSTAETSFYVTGGTLRPDAPSYVERQADRELYEGLRRGEFCYVLHARQMGKSSLMVHTTARLRQAGVAVAAFELTVLGQNVTVEQWYGGLLARIGRGLDLEEELEEYWLAHERQAPLQRWLGALQDVVLARVPGRIVLFLDEIDAVRSLPFSTDEFFAALRACYNHRTEDPAYERLTFCLLGVATPSDLIQDTRMTPFNIGRRIELTDFTAAEAAPLAQGLGGDPQRGQALLERVLHWTAGHPYLTQRLCQALARDGKVAVGRDVDRLCEALFLSPQARGQDDNLLFVRERLLKSEVELASLLELYARVRAGKRVVAEETNPLIELLRLAGIVRRAGGRLWVRNRIYARVFDREWISTHMPDAELRRQRAAYRRGLLRATAAAVVVVAAMASLVLLAFGQARRADRIARSSQEQLSQAQAERGVRLLEEENPLGLLDLLQARRTVEHIPEAREARALLWSGWHERWMGRLVHVMGHEGRVESVAFSQDGKLLSMGSEQSDPTARVWETATGQPLGPPCRLEPSASLPVAFSPDGKVLATSSWDAAPVRLWKTATGQPHGPPLRHQYVRIVAFSPDGKLLATSSQAPSKSESTVRLWETATGRPHGQPLRHQARSYQGGARALAFSPDGKLLATSWDETVLLWRTATGRPYGPPLRHRRVHIVAFSPNGRLLATGSDDGAIRLWQTASGRPHGLPLQHQGGVERVVFSPDGKLLAAIAKVVGVWHGTLRLWETGSGRPHGPSLEHRRSVEAVAFSPDGELLATGSDDGTIRLWETKTGQPHGLALRTLGSVDAVAFSPDGKLLATNGSDLRLWSSESGPPPGLPLPHEEHEDVRLVVFSPDGRLLATGSHFRTLRLWQTATARPHGRPFLHLGSQEVENVLFSPDGKLLATQTSHSIRLWDAATCQPLGPALRPQNQGQVDVSAVAFSPDGKLLATGWEDSTGSTARFWRTATGEPHGPPLRLEGDVRGMAFSPDGQLLATVSSSGMLQAWKVKTGRARGLPLRIQTGTSSELAFSPDGKLLATALRSPLQLWDVGTRQPHGPPLRQHQGIGHLAFSPDGKLLATGGGDAVRLWDMEPLRPRGQPLHHGGKVAGMAFSPDGKRLAIRSEDGTARLWETRMGLPLGPPLRQSPGSLSFSGHPSASASIAFSPDGKLLASASLDRTPRLWRIPPVPTDLREMELRTWVTVGARLDAQGGVEAIPWQEWQRLRAALRALEAR